MKIKIYHYLVFFITLITSNLCAESIEDYVALEFGNYTPIKSVVPYSDLVEYLELATNNNGKAIMGVAYKKIQSYKLITGTVVVKKENDKFVLVKADFPDISKIKNGKNRRKVASILKPLKNITFSPDDKKRIVDLTSGATRYGAESLNYFNYLARRVAIEINKYNEKKL